MESENALECPIHHEKPECEFIISNNWEGYQTYCKKCRNLFDKLYKSGKGRYFHSIWSLSCGNFGVKTASITLWNDTVDRILNNTDPSELFLIDILKMEFE